MLKVASQIFPSIRYVHGFCVCRNQKIQRNTCSSTKMRTQRKVVIYHQTLWSILYQVHISTGSRTLDPPLFQNDINHCKISISLKNVLQILRFKNLTIFLFGNLHPQELVKYILIHFTRVKILLMNEPRNPTNLFLNNLHKIENCRKTRLLVKQHKHIPFKFIPIPGWFIFTNYRNQPGWIAEVLDIF